MHKENKMNKASDKIFNMIEDGLIGYENVVSMCMSYMSEDDIADMMDVNEISDRHYLENGDISGL